MPSVDFACVCIAPLVARASVAHADCNACATSTGPWLSRLHLLRQPQRVGFKDNALALIARELRSKRRKGVVVTGAMSDPYNPFEQEYRLTRGAMKLIDAHDFGISIATKSDLVTRDIDVITSTKTHSPVLVKMTVTTADDELCRKVKPRAPVASRRFSAIRQLSENGIFTGILLMPVLPFIEDSDDNVVSIIRLASEAGARFIYPAFGVTLRQNQREWYYSKLDEHFPGLRLKYAKQFGNAYEFRSPRATELWRVFCAECDRLGILYKMEDIIEAYREPYREPFRGSQLSLS